MGEGKVICGIDLSASMMLIPSIFYDGHSVVKDEGRGDVDRKQVENLISSAEDVSSKCGIPIAYDVIASTDIAMERYLDLVSSLTSSPILIDSPSMEVRLHGVEYARNHGLVNRIIYNSVDVNSPVEEIEYLRSLRIPTVVMANNPRNPLPQGRIDVVKNVVSALGGVDVMIDVAVLDMPSIGLAYHAMRLVRELGYPVGCAPSNGVFMWKKGKEFGYDFVLSGVCAFLAECADFLLFGPIEYSPKVFPIVGIIRGMKDYGERLSGKRIPKDSPLFKIF